MTALLDIMHAVFKEIRHYPAFYGLMTLICPLLYLFLLWIDG